jgi:hypothetical protein
VVYILHRKGKLTIAKSKSLHLPFTCNVVVSLPLESILSKLSRYEADSVRFCGALYFEFIGIYPVGIIMKIMIVN